MGLPTTEARLLPGEEEGKGAEEATGGEQSGISKGCSVRHQLLTVAANALALYLTALFAGLCLAGAIDDAGLEPIRCGVVDALERLFWLTGERVSDV